MISTCLEWIRRSHLLAIWRILVTTNSISLLWWSPNQINLVNLRTLVFFKVCICKTLQIGPWLISITSNDFSLQEESACLIIIFRKKSNIIHWRIIRQRLATLVFHVRACLCSCFPDNPLRASASFTDRH